MKLSQRIDFRTGLSVLRLLGVGTVAVVVSGCASAAPTPAIGSLAPDVPQATLTGATYRDAATSAESDAHRHYDEALEADARGESSDAVIHYSQSIKADASFIAAYEGRAAAYHALGDEDSAVRDYDRVVKARPNAVTYTDRGHVSITAGRYAAAERDFQKALSLATNSNQHRLAYLGLADTHRARGEYEEAARYYTAAITLDSDDWNAYYGRGVALLAEEEYGRALEDFDQVISLKPHDAGAYYARGVLRWLSDQCAAAREDFRFFLALSSDGEDGARAREYLQRIDASANCDPPAGAESPVLPPYPVSHA